MALTSFSSFNCDKKLHGSEQNPERLWQSNTHLRSWYEQPYSAHPVGGIMISNIITHNLRHLLYNPKSESSLQDRLPLLVTLESQTLRLYLENGILLVLFLWFSVLQGV